MRYIALPHAYALGSPNKCSVTPVSQYHRENREQAINLICVNQLKQLASRENESKTWMGSWVFSMTKENEQEQTVC